MLRAPLLIPVFPKSQTDIGFLLDPFQKTSLLLSSESLIEEVVVLCLLFCFPLFEDFQGGMEMASLQGSTVFSVVHVKQNGITSSASPPFVKTKLVTNRYLGLKGISSRRALVDHQQHPKKCWMIRCSFSSSSNDYGTAAGNSSDNDADYVNSTVLEAVEVKSGPDEFLIKMRDGRDLKCVHNNPLLSQPPDYSLHPAIVLKMTDRTGLLLPIIVSEMPSLILTADAHNAQISRPTMHHVMKVMIEKMEYRVKLVRVTQRIHETYFAELHLVKFGNEAECFKFDMRPSDAINIAARYKVPIQVNRYLAFCDGVRVLNSAKTLAQIFPSDSLLFADPDRPNEQQCTETKEFNLLQNMLIATVEERYRDAAFWRDRLTQLRLREIWA